MSTITVIPLRYARELQEITEKHLDDLLQIFRTTAVDEGDRRFLMKRCAMEYANQVYRLKVDDAWRKEVEERKAS